MQSTSCQGTCLSGALAFAPGVILLVMMLFLYIATYMHILGVFRTATTNMRSGINGTTHQTTFVYLDPADSQYELQQRSPHGQLKAETDHQPFDGKKTTDAREMDAAGMFRVKVFDGQV
ncbi:hypothetical protein B0H17DRAFT_1152035 [Mycena rosella]|uniref:Uncharacterized protein n=1 Tax=Mycena rosella TaxID=1033263 RepID=A0AAD7BH58_MYCRO|nr:hypothetical protein B0H17DRAFT_1152035 [Mycena rosella]